MTDLNSSSIEAFIEKVDNSHNNLIKQIQSLDTFTQIIKSGIESYFEENKPESEKAMQYADKEAEELLAIGQNNPLIYDVKNSISKQIKNFADFKVANPEYMQFKKKDDLVNHLVLRIFTWKTYQKYREDFYSTIEQNTEYFYLSSLATLWTKYELFLRELVETTEAYFDITSTRRPKHRSSAYLYIEWLTKYGVNTDINDEKLTKSYRKIKQARDAFVHSLINDESIPSVLELQNSNWLEDASFEPLSEEVKLKEIIIPSNDIYTEASETIKQYSKYMKQRVLATFEGKAN